MFFDRVVNMQIKLTNAPQYTGYRGTLDIKNLRMAFSILKSESWATNTATIRVWNLGADNRNQIANFGDEVSLFAGYRLNEGAQLLFRGDTTQVSHQFAEPEIISVLTCGDGDRTLNNVVVAVSFGSNTPVKIVIESIVNQMSMQLASPIPAISETYALGFRGSGLGKDILDKACKAANLVWSVQNGKILILRQNQGSTKPPIEINENTGMLGVPERYTDKRGEIYTQGPRVGWKVRTLLRPDILPGDRIRIRSSKVPLDGLFYVVLITHQGDNFGPVFESMLEVIAV